jgi:hypothetical protein
MARSWSRSSSPACMVERLCSTLVCTPSPAMAVQDKRRASSARIRRTQCSRKGQEEGSLAWLAARTATTLMSIERKTANMSPYLDIGSCWREHEMEWVTAEQGPRGFGSSWSSGGVWRWRSYGGSRRRAALPLGFFQKQKGEGELGIEWR